MPDIGYLSKVQDAISEQVYGKEIPQASLTTKRVGGKPFIFSSDYSLDNAVNPGNVFTVDDAKKLSSSDINDAFASPFDSGNVDVKVAAIPMVINPSSIKWSQGKRTVQKDTMTGATFFHFSDRAGQNNDILKLEFTGNTGNIWNGQNKDPHNLRKLWVWHLLYRMSREPMKYVLRTQNGDIVKINRQRITYQTQLFPEIELTGFFNRVIEFEETAESPFNRSYSFGFTVTSTSPSLDAVLKDMNPGFT